jgi:hypothetical protein
MTLAGAGNPRMPVESRRVSSGCWHAAPSDAVGRQPQRRLSYAYSFQLLFEFAAARLKVAPAALALEQLDAGLIPRLPRAPAARAGFWAAGEAGKTSRLAVGILTSIVLCPKSEGRVRRTEPSAGLPFACHFAATSYSVTISRRSLTVAGSSTMPDSVRTTPYSRRAMADDIKPSATSSPTRAASRASGSP